MQHCLSSIAFLLLLLPLLLLLLWLLFLLLCDGKHISSMPILFASKNLFIGCGWTCAYITDAWLFESAYVWIWIQTAQSNDKNNKFSMLFVSLLSSLCVCVSSVCVCIECISWCVQVTTTCIDTTDVVCLQNQFNNSHVGTTAHSYDCEIKITLKQTHTHSAHTLIPTYAMRYDAMRCDATPCTTALVRTNPFSFLFECMRFKKTPKNITFYGCKLVSVFALQPQKANFSMGYYALFKFRLKLNIASAN